MEDAIPFGKRVIAAFGGLVKMAQATGWPVSTIESWKSKNSIPRWRLQHIRDAAQANHVSLPADFPSLPTGEARFGKSKKRNLVARPQQARGGSRAKQTGALAPATVDQPLVSYVTKAGHNYALLMSPAVAEHAGLAEGSRVEIEPSDDGRIVVTRSKRHFTLDELLAGMTPEREHPLEDDAPRGAEKL
jgi:antitoxin MazE